MRVHCPNCLMPVEMPEDWDGKDVAESLCNHCYQHTCGDPAEFGCRYIGNNAWDCGWIDGENQEMAKLL
jgi:hypothetical protein